MARFTISCTDELKDALDHLAAKRGDDRSGLVELLLREHPLLEEAIEEVRQEPGEGKPKRPRRETKVAVGARAKLPEEHFARLEAEARRTRP